MNWRLVTEFFASLGYGVLSSFVPLFNAELYVVATQALGITAEITAAIGVAVGQTIGKVCIVLGLRHGTRLPFLQRRITALTGRASGQPDRKPPGRLRLAYRRWSARLLDLIGDSRWGVPIVFVSGATGLPPILTVQFLVPATTMRTWVFALAMFLGRCVLFLAVAFGASAIIARLWP
jgi:membrane protein YqaA with SNARE-associated domain